MRPWRSTMWLAIGSWEATCAELVLSLAEGLVEGP